MPGQIREMQEFRDSITGAVFELPIFYLEGTLSQPDGLEDEITRIYTETTSEVWAGDPIPPRDVLLLSLREGEDWERRFWGEVNEACRPFAAFDRHDSTVALPRVVVHFPYPPELFLDENVHIRFSVRSYDERYNIITLLPSFVEIFGPNDEDVSLYLCTSAGYRLEMWILLNQGTDGDPSVEEELDEMSEYLPAWRG
ncbi:hypothetical protein C8J56DRAFT_1045622 [Mycena floridula]|nr:hypothetical protein C8J56DRAFT_1045622 [Mycena floridula]